MGIFSAIIDYFAEEGQQILIDTTRNELEQKVGTFGWAGQRYDAAYKDLHGETPAEERLRKFNEKHPPKYKL